MKQGKREGFKGTKDNSRKNRSGGRDAWLEFKRRRNVAKGNHAPKS